MAKLNVGSGIDNYITQLQNLEHTSQEAAGRAIYIAAGMVCDAIDRSISGIPDNLANSLQRYGLHQGLGISRMSNDDGFLNVKVGFAGYNQIKTKKFPGGQPNAMLARSIEGGTSFHAKHPFIAPAVKSVKDAAEKAMADELEKSINETMGG